MATSERRRAFMLVALVVVLIVTVSAAGVAAACGFAAGAGVVDCAAVAMLTARMLAATARSQRGLDSRDVGSVFMVVLMR